MKWGYKNMDPKLNGRTDDELVLLFKSGSGEAFEELVYRYKNSLYQYIMTMVQDEGAAGDLFQEVFISLFKHADKYEPRGKFKSWLFLTARNRVLNFSETGTNSLRLTRRMKKATLFTRHAAGRRSLPAGRIGRARNGRRNTPRGFGTAAAPARNDLFAPVFVF